MTPLELAKYIASLPVSRDEDTETLARALIESEQNLAAAQAALQSLSEWRVSCDDENACAQDESGPCMGHVIDAAISGGTAALDARIHAEKTTTRANIIDLCSLMIEEGRTPPPDADAHVRRFGAALDAALVRAREKMRARLIEAQARLLRAWTILSESPIADMPHEGVIQQVLMVTHETRDGRAELDAALVRAREEMRDAAVAAARAAWGNDGLPRSVTDAIAALPTTGGEP